MRGAFTSIAKGVTNSEDVTLDVNAELGDFGARRRR